MKSFNFALSTIALAFTVITPACSAAVDANTADSQDEVRAPIHPDFAACKVDSDCVAVARAGCCSNGWKDAVAKDKLHVYAATHVCRERILCPEFLVDDTRVAQCNDKKCEMVAVDEIACGGRTLNPHTCPEGFSCKGPDLAVDGPGQCLADMDDANQN